MRYLKVRKFYNDDEYFRYLVEKRPIKIPTHYATPIMKNPTVADRVSAITQPHIWSYGDRLSNLAHKYYGDVRYWWVIAWYNGVAMESQLINGDLIEIPINLQETLQILGV